MVQWRHRKVVEERKSLGKRLYNHSSLGLSTICLPNRDKMRKAPTFYHRDEVTFLKQKGRIDPSSSHPVGRLVIGMKRDSHSCVMRGCSYKEHRSQLIIIIIIKCK